MADSRGRRILLSTLGLLCVLLIAGGALRAEEGASAPLTFPDGTTAGYGTLADTLIARGAPSLPGLRAQVGSGTGKGRAYAVWTTARLLRALGRTDEAFAKTLEELSASASEPEVRRYATSAIGILGRATPLGGGDENGLSISTRKLVAALTDGNEHCIANNILVDQLLLHGQAALPTVLEAVRDPSFEGRGYAAWALAKIVRGTGADPRMAIPALEMAMQSKDDYVRALARSGRSILRGESAPVKAPVRRLEPLRRLEPVRRRAPASAGGETKPEPGAWIVSAVKDAPPPTASVDDLVRAMPEREGYWQEIVLDRLLAKGAASVEALQKAAKDETYGARPYAAWGLARLVRALGRPGSEAEPSLCVAAQSTDAEVRRYVAAGRRILDLKTPLGSGDEDGAALEIEALIGALVDGQVGPNNVLVDQLLLHGEAAIAPLLKACGDDGSKAPFYTAWALAKVLRATGKRPEEAVEMFKARYAPDRSPRIILGF